MEVLEKNNELDEFLYIISHDLKAPVISIQGYANLIVKRHGGEVSQELKKYLDRINKNAERLEDMVNGLVELSRIGRMDKERDQISLSGVVKDVLAEFSSKVGERSGKVDFSDSLPTINANKDRIKQLFSILVDNSLRFSDPVEVEISVEEAKEPETIGLYYRDLGAKIPNEKLEEIFKLFYTTGDLQGHTSLGLGLSYAKRILEKHGGSIWAESDGDSGVKFHMVFSKIS